MTDWYITLPYATFLVSVERGAVTNAAPIARWMIGKPWSECKPWIAHKGGHGQPLEARPK